MAGTVKTFFVMIKGKDERQLEILKHKFYETEGEKEEDHIKPCIARSISRYSRQSGLSLVVEYRVSSHAHD